MVALKAAKRARPTLQVVDSVDELRLVDKSGGRTQLLHGTARFIVALAKLGVRFHAKASRRRRPREVIPWLGFERDAKKIRARLTLEKRDEGETLPLR